MGYRGEATNQLGAGSLTIIDAKSFVNSGAAALNLGAGIIDSNAKLMLISDHNLKADEHFIAVQADTQQMWQKETYANSSRLLNVSVNNDGERTTASVSAADMNRTLGNISNATASLLNDMVKTMGVNTNSANQGQQLISRAGDVRYITDNVLGGKIIESALNIASVVGVQNIAANLGFAAANSVQQYLSSHRHVKASDDTDNVWVAPMYGHRRADSFEMGGRDVNTDTNYGGLIIGADHTFADSLAGGDIRFGLAANVGGGKSKTSNAVSPTENSFDFWGMTLYSAWNSDNFNITADFGFSKTKHEMKQYVPAALGLSDLKANVDTNLFSTGLRAQYVVSTPAFDVLPHVGARYLHLNTNDFSTRNAQGELFSTKGNSQNIWSFPVGVSVYKDMVTKSGLNVKPVFDLSYIASTGDVRAKSKVSMAGLNQSVDSGARVMDRSALEGRVGIELKKSNYSVGLNYSVQSSPNEMEQGVMATLNLSF
ncbi:autotransporter outer membrane beta-barrel domain-containing protein [Serratia sp. L9]|uniref:autotransporter outer membrane beta-barrel domain-containing protein n=1 Tax=Serratia sp. L9 TaxID=3423946 RepID=UPI003D67C1DC